jgi:LacI family transcriptional regulator
LITLLGQENEWLKQLDLRTPDDVSLICLNRPINSPLPGMQENHEVIGGTTAELVINQILHSEYGLPENPRLILIKGLWAEGSTLPSPCTS